MNTFAESIQQILAEEGMTGAVVLLSNDPIKARLGFYLVHAPEYKPHVIEGALRRREAWVLRAGPGSDVYVLDFRHKDYCNHHPAEICDLCAEAQGLCHNCGQQLPATGGAS